jgi:hypothetical protein
VRIGRGARREPPLSAAAGAAARGPVSVVVPARDEAARIGPLLAALAGDPAGRRGRRRRRPVQRTGPPRWRRPPAPGSSPDVPSPPAGWASRGRCSRAWRRRAGAGSSPWTPTSSRAAGSSPRWSTWPSGRAWTSSPPAGASSATPPGQRLLHPAMLVTLVYRFGPPGVRRTPPAGRDPGERAVHGRPPGAVPRRRRLPAGGGQHDRRRRPRPAPGGSGLAGRLRRRHRPARGPHARHRRRRVAQLGALPPHGRRDEPGLEGPRPGGPVARRGPAVATRWSSGAATRSTWRCRGAVGAAPRHRARLRAPGAPGGGPHRWRTSRSRCASRGGRCVPVAPGAVGPTPDRRRRGRPVVRRPRPPGRSGGR